MIRVTLTLVALMCLVGSLMASDIPYMVNVQGKLTDAAGAPLPDDDYVVTFTIYDDSTGGVIVWQQTRLVEVRDGLFAELLGKDVGTISGDTALPLEVFNQANRYLGIKVSTDPEMMPRQQIVAMPYAYYSETADSAYISVMAYYAESGGGWTDSGTVVKLYTVDDTVLIGTNESDPPGKLCVEAPGGKAFVALVQESTSGSGKYAGYFDATGEGSLNIGLFSRVGCYGTECEPASWANIALLAAELQGPISFTIPNKDLAGLFLGDVSVSGDLSVTGDLSCDEIVGWDTIVQIDPGEIMHLSHGVGGDPFKYLVFMYGKADQNDGFHQANIGTNPIEFGLTPKWIGCEWFNLGEDNISIRRAPDDEDAATQPSYHWDSVMVRIIPNQ